LDIGFNEISVSMNCASHLAHGCLAL
jgi:hypothetical protein